MRRSCGEQPGALGARVRPAEMSVLRHHLPMPADASGPLHAAVLDDYLDVARALAPWESLDGVEVRVFTRPIGGPEELVSALEPFEVVCAMRERTPLPREILARLPNLRLIVTTGMQNASIDVAYARERGIVVSGTESSAAATVELTWALILGAARHVAANDRGMRAGGWQRQLGVALAGRRLGVIGLGRNGSRVAAIGQAFGMDVVAWSQNLSTDHAAAIAVTPVTKDELLETSDVVTIHLRLSDRTHGLIGREELALMRADAILVNTSRGQIVDEPALLDALRGGGIGAAALDVYDDEPLPADHPFRSLDNVLLSPHMGYVTDENMRRFYEQTVEDIRAYQAGSPIRVL
jgi:phosphoglycerate dehydrogenase-like enzyme